MSGQDPNASHAFPTTSWSLVLRAGQDDSQAREALGILLQRYLPALRAHLVIHRRYPVDAADDLLQGFVSQKIMQQKLIARSDRARGRFRNLLIKALIHHAVDELRRQRARGVGMTAPLGESNDLDLLAGDDHPSDAFNNAWAKQVVAEAVKRIRHECAALGRRDFWSAFEQRILRPTLYGVDPTPYETLVSELGLTSVTQAYNLLVTAKRMFERCMRGVLSESAENEDEVEEDLRDLGRFLSVPQD